MPKPFPPAPEPPAPPADYPPVTDESIARAKAAAQIELCEAQVTRDKLYFLHLVDTYGEDRIATWLMNVSADRRALRKPSPGTITDPRR